MKLLFALIFVLPLSALDLSVSGKSAILMDAKTGHILYEKGAFEERPPASITKILTVLIALEEKGSALDEKVVVPREAVGSISPQEKRKANYQLPSHWIETASSHVGLKVGEEVTLEMLLYGVMLESGNDASNTLAYHIAGDIPTFVTAMNIRAEQLGCKKTHFTNPHGLHHPDHVTCAYDMAVMTREAMQYPLFRKMSRTQFWKKGTTNKQEGVMWVQHNQLVRRGKKYHYPKAIGVKTGRTDDAGATLVGAAQEGDRELVAVVLGCESFPNAYKDLTGLFEAAFQEQRVQQCLVRAGPQLYKTAIEGSRKSIATYTTEDALIEYLPSYAPHVHTEVVWEALEVPLVAGERVGEVQVVTDGGELWAATPLYARHAVKARFTISDIAHLPNRVKAMLVASCAGVFLLLAFRSACSRV